MKWSDYYFLYLYLDAQTPICVTYMTVAWNWEHYNSALLCMIICSFQMLKYPWVVELVFWFVCKLFKWHLGRTLTVMINNTSIYESKVRSDIFLIFFWLIIGSAGILKFKVKRHWLLSNQPGKLLVLYLHVAFRLFCRKGSTLFFTHLHMYIM